METLYLSNVNLANLNVPLALQEIILLAINVKMAIILSTINHNAKLSAQTKTLMQMILVILVNFANMDVLHVQEENLIIASAVWKDIT